MTNQFSNIFYLLIFLFIIIEQISGNFIERNNVFEEYNENNTDLCPPNWILFQNKCYVVHEGLEVNAAEAEQICNSQSAELPSIRSEDVHNFLSNWLLSVTNISQAWTSGQKVNFSFMQTGKNGGITWFWSNNMGFEYKKWHTGHPQNGVLLNCLMLRNSYDNGRPGPQKYDWQNFFDWSSSSCLEKAAVICEKPACTKDWIEFKGRCYKTFKALKMTHFEAKQHCKLNGGDLISISSKSEDRFLSSLLRETCNSPFVWTSGKCSYNRYNNYQMNWIWEELNIKFGYTNWLQGNPPCNQELCVNLQNQVSMTNDTRLQERGWFYHACNEKFPFVCRKKPEN